MISDTIIMKIINDSTDALIKSKARMIRISHYMAVKIALKSE